MIPRRMRWMAGLCALVCSLTMFGATTDFFTAARLSSVQAEVEKTEAKDYMQQLTLHMTKAQLSAWSDMRGARMVIAIFVSLAAGLSFAAALRILMPKGLRREGMRLLLIKALLWTTGARVMAGAADTGTLRYAAESLKKQHAKVPGRDSWLATLPETDRKAVDEFLTAFLEKLPTAVVVASALYTLLVAAILVMFWRYFSRDEVKKTLETADDAPPPSRL